jgi:hypothetical protein
MKNSKSIAGLLVLTLLLLASCSEGEVLISTGDVLEVLPTSAKVSGHILSIGDGIKQYGHCYSTTANPTVNDTRTEFGVAIGVGNYTSILYGLDPETIYYIRAYAICGSVTVYGDEINFTTSAVQP